MHSFNILNLSIILISFIINNSLIAEFIRADLVPLPKPEIVIDAKADQEHKEKYLKEKAKKKYFESHNQQDIALLEEAFDQAPAKVKALVYAMLNNEEFAKRYKYILLAGPSGSGKSILAEAIPYILGRKCIVIDAPSLLGHYRDQAAENIRDAFRRMSEDPDKPFLVINEINALTDGHTSEHSDTKHTAMQLWTLLDKHKNDKDFQLIATTNVTKKMPHQLQSRFEGKTFLIDNPSVEARKRTIEFWLKHLNIEKDESCTNSYLNELAIKTNNFSRRCLATLIDYSLLLSVIKNPGVAIRKVTKEFLEQAFIELSKQKEEFWDFTEHTTDEERRHRENLAQHTKHFEENQQLQIKIAEWGMLYQGFMKHYEEGSRAGWKNVVEELNTAKSLALPNEKPAAKITVISPATLLYSEKAVLERNNDTKKASTK